MWSNCDQPTDFYEYFNDSWSSIEKTLSEIDKGSISKLGPHERHEIAGYAASFNLERYAKNHGWIHHKRICAMDQDPCGHEKLSLFIRAGVNLFGVIWQCDDSCLMVLTEALRNGVEIQSLEVDINKASYERVKEFVWALRLGAELKYLGLWYRHLRKESREAIAEAFEGGTHHEILKLIGYVSTDRGASSLFQTLTRSSRLRFLELSGSIIGDNGIKALSEALIEGVELYCLLLRTCSISDAQALQLVNAIKSGSSVYYLDLSRNYISNEGAQGFAEAIQGGCQLRELILFFNNITDEGAMLLLDAMKSAPEFRKLNLRSNDITWEFLAKDELPFFRALLSENRLIN